MKKYYQPPDQSRMIGQAKFTYSSLGKAFLKQIKTIDHQGEKQINILVNYKLHLLI